jgi:hypothetical protein
MGDLHEQSAPSRKKPDHLAVYAPEGRLGREKIISPALFSKQSHDQIAA